MGKRGKIAFLLGVLFLLSGCESLSRNKQYYLKSANVEFTLPKVWEEVEDDAYALSLSNESTNLVMNSYSKSDIQDLSAPGVFHQLIEEFLADMDTSSLVREYPVEKTTDRIVYQKLYTANKDLMERQYYFGLVDFLGTDHYVFVVYQAGEMIMNYNIDDIQRVLLRMECKDLREDLVLY